METRTITIKSFEKTSGKKQDQTEWHRISIKATDGKFYSSFKPIAEAALAPGAQLKLQVVQSKIKENTYEIQKVLGFVPPGAGFNLDANPNGRTQSGEITTPNPAPPALDEAEAYARYLLKKQKGETAKEPDPLLAQIEQSDSYARELTKRARRIAEDEMPAWEHTSEYPYFIATLINVMYGKISGDRIAQQEAEKLKAYGNKKW